MSTRTAVGGCEVNDPEDPGNLQLDWLEVQLATFRSRGMQVTCLLTIRRHHFGCWRYLTIWAFAGVDQWSRTAVREQLSLGMRERSFTANQLVCIASHLRDFY